MSVKWNVLPPQIKYDKFYNDIIHTLQTNDVQHVLEIGASSGEGSTEAIMVGRGKNTAMKVFTIEVCKERFERLEVRWLNAENFFPYNVSSVPLSVFPTKADIEKFCAANPHCYEAETAYGWLCQDIEYVTKNNVYQNGIEKIKQDSGISVFDCILIDGSEFLGIPELDLLYGAKIVMLDDTVCYKNNYNRSRLLNDPNYTVLVDEPTLRNGYSIFKRNH